MWEMLEVVEENTILLVKCFPLFKCIFLQTKR